MDDEAQDDHKSQYQYQQDRQKRPEELLSESAAR
jgi:hypothetical protein